MKKMILIILLLSFCSTIALAKEDNDQTLKDSLAVIDEIMNSPDREIPSELISQAKAVLIFPTLVKAGFLVGGRYGNGVASMRSRNSGKFGPKADIARIGHTNQEMISWINNMDPIEVRCKNFILSGGITNPLEGYNLIKSCKYKSVMGMASGLLKYSMGEYQILEEYLDELNSTLLLCEAYLK